MTSKPFLFKARTWEMSRRKAVSPHDGLGANMIVQVARMSDGSRRITHITELPGAYSDTISLNDIFLFEKKGRDAQGKVKGRFYATGIMPKFGEKLLAAGLPLPVNMMNHSVEV